MTYDTKTHTLKEIAEAFDTDTNAIFFELKQIVNKIIDNLVDGEKQDIIEVLINIEPVLNISPKECYKKLNKKNQFRFLKRIEEKYGRSVDKILGFNPI